MSSAEIYTPLLETAHSDGKFLDLDNQSQGEKQKYADIPANTSSTEWWIDLCNAVANGEVHSASERLGETNPFYVTFQLDIEGKDDDEGLWTKVEPLLVENAQKVLDSHYDLKEETLGCVVLRSDRGYSGNSSSSGGEEDEDERELKYEIELYFPFLPVDFETAGLLKKEIARALGNDREVAILLEEVMANAWSNSIRESLNATHRPIYGAVVGKRAPLIYSCYYGVCRGMHQEIRELYVLEPVFTTKSGTRIHQMLDIEQMPMQNMSEHWLPVILSVHVDLDEPKLRNKAARDRKNGRIGSVLPIPEPNADRLELSRFFISLLAAERFQARISWQHIGCALKTEFRGSAEGLKLFQDYTRLHGSFNNLECKIWYGKSHLTTHRSYMTLAEYAQVDNEELYSQWHSSWVEGALIDVLKLRDIGKSSLSVAEAFYRQYWMMHACSDLETRTVYFFNGVRWVKEKGMHELWDCLNKSFRQFLLKKAGDFSVRGDKADKNTDRDTCADYQKRTLILREHLEKHGLRQSIIVDSLHNFYGGHMNFERMMDEALNLYATANCVLECVPSTGEVIVRQGSREDYLTIATDVEYRTDFTLESPEIKQYMRHYEKLFADPATRHFVLKYDASELLARNRDKVFVEGMGATGNNGKTGWQSLKDSVHTVGQYACTIPAKYFEVDTNTLGPSGFLRKGMHARVASIREINSNVMYSAARIKKHVGLEPVEARSMREDGVVRIPHYKLSSAGNSGMTFDICDEAMDRKMIIIPFNSRFVDSGYPEDPEEQDRRRIYPAEFDMHEMVSELAEAGLWLRVHYFPVYCEERLRDVPKEIETSTKKYWADYNPFLRFKGKRIVEDEMGSAELEKMYIEYVTWYKAYYPTFPLPSIINFKETARYQLGEPDQDDTWHGWSVVYSSRGGGWNDGHDEF